MLLVLYVYRFGLLEFWGVMCIYLSLWVTARVGYFRSCIV